MRQALVFIIGILWRILVQGPHPSNSRELCTTGCLAAVCSFSPIFKKKRLEVVELLVSAEYAFINGLVCNSSYLTAQSTDQQ